MPVGTSAWTPIANLTLTGTASSVTFSSINQQFRDLVLVANTTNSDTSGLIAVRFNNDTGANQHRGVNMQGAGGVRSDLMSGTAALPGAFTWAASLTTTVINVMDYSQTDKHKAVIIRAGNADTGSYASANRWNNTAAITSITVMASAAATPTFAAGSSFALYGVSA